MKSYRRIMLGRKSVHAPACFAGGFIGIDFGLYEDLSQQLPEDWRDFNHAFIPRVMAAGHSSNKIGAGLACGFTWTLCKGLQIGDIVLSPDGTGVYRVGEVTGNYYYAEGEILPPARQCLEKFARWMAVNSEAIHGTTASPFGSPLALPSHPSQR